MLDQCRETGKSQEIVQRSSLFSAFSRELNEDSVKISDKAEDIEEARAAEGCTEHSKKGHETSMRVLAPRVC